MNGNLVLEKDRYVENVAKNIKIHLNLGNGVKKWKFWCKEKVR